MYLLFQLTFLLAVVVVSETARHAFDPRPRPKRQAEILDYVNERYTNGGYYFRYRTSDGTSREETGKIRDEGTDHEVLEVSGRVSWIAPDGREYSVVFVSNENGYQPMGAHLPTSTRKDSPADDEKVKLVPEVLRQEFDGPQTRISDSTLISLLGG